MPEGSKLCEFSILKISDSTYFTPHHKRTPQSYDFAVDGWQLVSAQNLVTIIICMFPAQLKMMCTAFVSALSCFIVFFLLSCSSYFKVNVPTLARPPP
jgi:hypothetical protein